MLEKHSEKNMEAIRILNVTIISKWTANPQNLPKIWCWIRIRSI